ncbi:efflux RND transporter periplasmic adaptor subunit [Desulfospira joergensenii]|uniref:efflux RND transporter periplasmic adaptor subunit n=1 Tax=Desulfospira joergensenii TaxID=53329 RepID=UPI0003B6659F|nr:efflux RND transporter periplasmic adaptor subunit [Desulfospira joergensenii]
MKKKPIILILVILILAGGVSGVLLFKNGEDNSSITASGNIEVTDVSLGFKIAGRLDVCLKDEGDSVSKGDVLARLENQDQKVALRLAKINLGTARSMLEELKAGSRPEEIRLAKAAVQKADQVLLELTRGSRAQEIETARADLKAATAARESARAQMVQAKEDFQRFSNLYAKQSASQRDFKLFQTQYQVAEKSLAQAESRENQARQSLSLVKEGPRTEEIERARADLAQAQAQYDLVQAGPRQEKIDQAEAGVAEAKAQVEQAKLALSYTELIAPMDGKVFSRSAEPGEYLNPATPVLVVGDLAHPWLRAYVSEKDLGRLSLGQKVEVSTDSFPDKTYDGTLSFISSEAEFTPKAVQTFEERVKLMFRIKVDLANPKGELRPGMPADAHISISAE